MRKKSEAILDFILAFIGVAILTLGIARIWVWFNVNYAGKQVSYQKSRILAGSPKQFLSDSDLANRRYYNATFPDNATVGSAASKKCPSCWNKPLDLTEKWVFQGVPSGQIKLSTSGGWGDILRVNCEAECSGKPGEPPCGDCTVVTDPATGLLTCEKNITTILGSTANDTFNPECPCFLHCQCRKDNAMVLAGLDQQVYQLCGDSATFKTDFILDNATGNYTHTGLGNPRPGRYNMPGGGNTDSINVTGCGGASSYYNDTNDHRWKWSPLPVPREMCTSCPNTCGELVSNTTAQAINVTAAYNASNTTPWCGQACLMCKHAAGMRHEAKKCCDTWDMCWWFTWGKTCKPMKQAAAQLENAALSLADEGRRMQVAMYKIEKCCLESKYDTIEEQEACLEDTVIIKSCEDRDALDDLLTQRIKSYIGDNPILQFTTHDANLYPLTPPKKICNPIVWNGCRDMLHPRKLVCETTRTHDGGCGYKSYDYVWQSFFPTASHGDDNLTSIGSIDTACKLKQEIENSLDYSHLHYFDYKDEQNDWHFHFGRNDCYYNVTPDNLWPPCSGCARVHIGNPALPNVTIYPRVPYYTNAQEYWEFPAFDVTNTTEPVPLPSGRGAFENRRKNITVTADSAGNPIDWRKIVRLNGNGEGVYADGTTVPKTYIDCMNDPRSRSPYWKIHINNTLGATEALGVFTNETGLKGIPVWGVNEAGCAIDGTVAGGIALTTKISQDCSITSLLNCTENTIARQWQEVGRLWPLREKALSCCDDATKQAEFESQATAECAGLPCPPDKDCATWPQQCVHDRKAALEGGCIKAVMNETGTTTVKLSCAPATGPFMNAPSPYPFSCYVNLTVDNSGCNFRCANLYLAAYSYTGSNPRIYSGVAEADNVNYNECAGSCMDVQVPRSTCYLGCANTYLRSYTFTQNTTHRTYQNVAPDDAISYESCADGTCVEVRVQRSSCYLGCAATHLSGLTFYNDGAERVYSTSQTRANNYYNCANACVQVTVPETSCYLGCAATHLRGLAYYDAGTYRLYSTTQTRADDYNNCTVTNNCAP